MKNGLHTDEYGIKRWYKDGKLHREDGPAIIFTDGDKHWYRNGVLHREDGPAYINSDGVQLWYRYGQKHRLDGPAVVGYGIIDEWWINGKLYIQLEFNNQLVQQNLKSILFPN